MDKQPPFFPQLAEIAAFKSRLLAQPDALYKARLTLADADRAIATIKRRVADAKGALQDCENEVAVEVAAQKDQFTNETLRKTETKRRLGASVGYQQLLKALGSIEAELLDAEVTRTRAALDVQRLEDEQRSIRTHADLTCAEVQLLVAGR